MSDAVEGLGGLIIFLIGIVFVTSFFGWQLFPSDITTYPSLCKENVVNNRCSTPGDPLTSETYIPNESRQEVLYLDNYNVWQKYTRCAIKDIENWSCQGNDKNSRLGFTSGKYWELLDPRYIEQYYTGIPPQEVIGKVYFLSRPNWILRWCKNGRSTDYVCIVKMAFNYDDWKAFNPQFMSQVLNQTVSNSSANEHVSSSSAKSKMSSK
jgi:hypothetical protein